MGSQDDSPKPTKSDWGKYKIYSFTYEPNLSSPTYLHLTRLN